MVSGSDRNKDKTAGICSVCAKPSATPICTACEARIRGEILDQKDRAEKEGHTDTGRH